jgi:hypothetical protein
MLNRTLLPWGLSLFRDAHETPITPVTPLGASLFN